MNNKAVAFIAIVTFAIGLLVSWAASPQDAPTDTPKVCTTFQDIKDENAGVKDPIFVHLTDDQFAKLIAAMKSHGVNPPDGVTNAYAGRTPDVPGVVYLYGMDKDGCEVARGHLSDQQFIEALTGGVNSKKGNDGA